MRIANTSCGLRQDAPPDDPAVTPGQSGSGDRVSRHHCSGRLAPGVAVSRGRVSLLVYLSRTLPDGEASDVHPPLDGHIDTVDSELVLNLVRVDRLPKPRVGPRAAPIEASAHLVSRPARVQWAKVESLADQPKPVMLSGRAIPPACARSCRASGEGCVYGAAHLFAAGRLAIGRTGSNRGPTDTRQGA